MNTDSTERQTIHVYVRCDAVDTYDLTPMTLVKRVGHDKAVVRWFDGRTYLAQRYPGNPWFLTLSMDRVDAEGNTL